MSLIFPPTEFHLRPAVTAEPATPDRSSLLYPDVTVNGEGVLRCLRTGRELSLDDLGKRIELAWVDVHAETVMMTLGREASE